MVAVMWCGASIEKYLNHGDWDGAESFTVARGKGAWHGGKPHLTLLMASLGATDAGVIGLARTRLGRGISTVERSVLVEELHLLEPFVAVHELEASLPHRHRSVCEREGPLVDSGNRDLAGGKHLIAALLRIRPDLEHVVEELSLNSSMEWPVGAAGELWAMERDSTGVLLDIAGVGRDELRDWRPQGAEPVPFLAGLPQRPPLEDQIITHDAARFLEWIPEDAAHVGWRVFHNQQQRLFVANVNQTNVEHTLGVDLIYFHEQRGSFVLVQYKKMRQESDGEWRYRPDHNLWSELSRMRGVDDTCAGQDGPFRLYPVPCWMKICRPQNTSTDLRDLIKGMYLAREYFEELMVGDTVRGGRGGIRFGYDNVPRHLDNTTFTKLVGGGWIGSRGAGTQWVWDQIRASLAASNAVVFGVQSGRTAG